MRKGESYEECTKKELFKRVLVRIEIQVSRL